MRRVLCVGSLLNLGVAVSLAAQQLKPMFVRWEPPAASPVSAVTWRADQRDTALVPRRDYRYEGLAFGGIVFGALGTWIGSQVTGACPTVPGAQCEPDRLGNGVAAGVAGGALGGGLGYLVGRLSSKPAPVEQAGEPLRTSAVPDSARRRVGYHHWKGAAIGSVSGALLGGLLLLGVGRGCADCELTHGDLLKTGIAGAGLGGAFGFLVGLASPKYESPPGKTTPE